jgi:predicted nuclease with TOPRIM domain
MVAKAFLTRYVEPDIVRAWPSTPIFRMSANKLIDLEAKVKGLLLHLQEIKRRNVQLEDRLREADGQLARQQATIRRSEKEREWLRGKLRKVVGELDTVELGESSLRD